MKGGIAWDAPPLVLMLLMLSVAATVATVRPRLCITFGTFVVAWALVGGEQSEQGRRGTANCKMICGWSTGRSRDKHR